MSEEPVWTTIESAPGDVAAALGFAEQVLCSDLIPTPASIPDHVLVFDRPAGRFVEHFDLSRFLPSPERQTGAVELHTAQSLVEWVKAMGSERHHVYGNVYALSMTAVLSPGVVASPAWDDLRGVVTLKRSERWNAWRAINGKVLPQADFAAFAQERASDFLTPTALDVLEIAETLSLNVGAKVSSAVRMRDGQRRIVFDESIEASAGGALEVEIPEQITFRVPVFDGAVPQEITAKFLYRKVQTGVGIAIHITDVSELEREAFAVLLSEVGEALDVEPFAGCAP